MNPSNALGDFQQTALILIPEFILLFTAVGIMTASAFVSRSRDSGARSARAHSWRRYWPS